MIRFRLRSLLFLIAGAAVLICTWLYWWPIDGIVSYALSAICTGEDTVWAEGYTDTGFRGICIGMSRKTVHERLGEPILSQVGWSGDLWESWTYSPGSTHYWRRDIIFHNDVVANKIAEFYVD